MQSLSGFVPPMVGTGFAVYDLYKRGRELKLQEQELQNQITALAEKQWSQHLEQTRALSLWEQRTADSHRDDKQLLARAHDDHFYQICVTGLEAGAAFLLALMPVSAALRAAHLGSLGYLHLKTATSLLLAAGGLTSSLFFTHQWLSEGPNQEAVLNSPLEMQQSFHLRQNHAALQAACRLALAVGLVPAMLPLTVPTALAFGLSALLLGGILGVTWLTVGHAPRFAAPRRPGRERWEHAPWGAGQAIAQAQLLTSEYRLLEEERRSLAPISGYFRRHACDWVPVVSRIPGLASLERRYANKMLGKNISAAKPVLRSTLISRVALHQRYFLSWLAEESELFLKTKKSSSSHLSDVSASNTSLSANMAGVALLLSEAQKQQSCLANLENLISQTDRHISFELIADAWLAYEAPDEKVPTPNFRLDTLFVYGAEARVGRALEEAQWREQMCSFQATNLGPNGLGQEECS